jgi:hypothetical protein
VQEAGRPDLPTALASLAEVRPADSKPVQALALTGGVAGAPFAAGVLVGWSEAGTRPTFDEVTGVSSGSLIGAYAFLGPKYDANVQRLILNLKTADLIKLRPVRYALHNGAFGSNEPAERLLQTEINDAFLADLRQAHAEGRRFFVGTMNLETKRLAIWDMGAIASSGRPDADDLVRKVLLASIAWPGFVPPVEFNVEVNGHWYHEQHYDGGPAAMAFMRSGPLAKWPEQVGRAQSAWLPGSNLYVLACRKLYANPAPVPKRALPRLMSSVGAIFEALTRADIARLYAVCTLTGTPFHLLALPQDSPEESISVGDMYPKEPHILFDKGYQMGAAGPPWRLTPPELEPGDQPNP